MTTVKPIELVPADPKPPQSPTCPLCHTVDETLSSDALAAGGTWRCTRCGQMWSAERLATAAAYALTQSAAPSRVM